TICLKCLEKDPRRRYPSAAALADDLGRYLDGRPTLARPPGTPERLAKWVRRRPTLAALIAVCLLGLAALVIGAAVYESRLAAAGRGWADARRTGAGGGQLPQGAGDHPGRAPLGRRPPLGRGAADAAAAPRAG